MHLSSGLPQQVQGTDPRATKSANVSTVDAGSGRQARQVYRTSQTHNLPLRGNGTSYRTSENLGWHSIHETLACGMPFEASFAPIDDLWIAIAGSPIEVAAQWAGRRQQKTIMPGMLSLVPRGLSVNVRVENDNKALHLHLRDSLVKEAAAEFGRGDPDRIEIVPVFGAEDPTGAGMGTMFQHILEHPDPVSSLLVDYWAAVLASYMVRTYSAKAAPGQLVLPFTLSKPRLGRVRDYIEANLRRPVTLAELAGVAALSVPQFIRQFKASTGITPHQYLMRMRIERARCLLTTTDIPVMAIALDCGFATQAHMTRVFRTLLGTTPAAYRKEVGE
ncbi:AraC family transcriptional regulator [Mesorhizobium australicum]|uniref:AraC family transcriptional regulator n=1 Tax=Mesorhizobium australicum TaxID=536018 RepID=UPI00333564AD